MDTTESSAPKQSTVIHFRLPERRSARLTPPAPVPTIDKEDEMILQDTLQIEKMVEGSENVIDDSLLYGMMNQRSGTRLEPRSDKESPEVDITKDKEVEITNDEEVEVTNVAIPVNVNEDEEEITDEVYELKRREKGKIVEESRSTPFPPPISSPRIHTDLVSSDTEKLQELTVTNTTPSSRSPSTNLSKTNRLLSLFKAKHARFKRYKNFFQELQGCYTYLFEHLKARFLSRKSFDTLADHLQEVMVESLPTMVDTHIKDQVKKQVTEQVQDQVPVYVAKGLILERLKTKEEMEWMIAKAIYFFFFFYKRWKIQAEISLKSHKAIRLHIPSQVMRLLRRSYYVWTYFFMFSILITNTLLVPETTIFQLYLSMKVDPQLQTTRHSQYGLHLDEFESPMVNENEQGLSTSENLEQEDDYDFWTESYASDDDEIPTKQMSQDIMEEVSLTIDEAKLKKMVDEIKEILVSPHPRKATPLVQSCQRDPEAPALSLINQDLLYLKKGSSGPEKIVLSLHKFPTIIFNDDDIEERTSRWVNTCVKKFNPYDRYGVEHWKNPHAKIFYIKKQKEPGKPKEEVYLNLKIIQVVKTYWELGHEHKFIIEIVAKRANECIVSITEPDYKNLNKNDIEDMYLLIMNGKVSDYAKTWMIWSLSIFIRSLVIWERVHDFQLGIESYQQKVNLTAPTISFLGVEKHKMFSIIYEPVHGIIYKNSKKDKRVMRHSEIHKFCDATLNRVLEGLKSYNNDVKYGY
ncbi:hypothetical protein Tco_0704456 [Tanacetum coccineum]|uniref:Uncharacterized protein n=1 Tax=Tanacetum coccineum TaxID=301880 RepID=A0ABQ4Y2N7_9ASTR